MVECVGAVILQQDSILLGRRSADRSFFPNVWDVFGGHVEAGESWQQALERELGEELGIVPISFRYLETLTLPGASEDSLACHLFVVTEWSGTPVNRQAHEHSEIKWFELGQTTDVALASPDYPRIFEGLKG